MDKLVRLRLPLAVFVLAALVYVLLLGDRRGDVTHDGRHFVHLAQSLLRGELGVPGNQPVGTNDWACFDAIDRGPCPPNRYSFPASEAERYRWYVSFPPLPAVVLAPFVLAFGADVPDRLVWAVLAGLGPALLFVLLRFLRETGRSARRLHDDLFLTALFAFGSVYFFTAVQGTVWFAAHVVAVPLLCLYVLFALDARRPALAGLVLALAFVTRPTTALLGLLFVLEAMRVSRKPGAVAPGEDASIWERMFHFVAGTNAKALARRLAPFGVPIVAVGALAMWMNQARFGDPFEFGHAYLQIRWRPRIERWGLFNFHYLGKNLAVFVAALPWLSATRPFVTISRHGLALWLTTPHLLAVLWPKRTTATMVALALSAGAVCLVDLCYQNSGWVQFGYRFALDYMVLLFALLSMGGRRFGWGSWALLVFAVAVNAFGAVTFDRAWMFYDADPTQDVIFHPD